MSPHPILLIGGSGAVGRWAARFLRDAHPDTPLLIGGRDLDKTRRVAAEVGHAEGVVVDLGADDLGLGERFGALPQSRITQVALPRGDGRSFRPALRRCLTRA